MRFFWISISLFAAFAVTAQADEMARTVSVDGKGFVMIKPDMARLSLAVEERDPSLESAQEAVAETTAQVLDLLDDLDVEERYINSTGAMVHPDYRWNRQSEKQELIGYVVRRGIEVELRDLDQLGELIEGAVGAGVNQVSPPALDSTKRRAAYRQALAKAAADARKNAEALAEAMDVDVGDVRHINAGRRMPTPMPVARGMATLAMAEAGDGGQATYNPGEMRLEANITAVFELDD
ncbi:MAG: SIMPL domain-containing protein [Gammaproteobacteria bacterium]|nr:SIMPL domain-containing protein [Gammaproteobacteria bacterium]NND37166.1 SIMPL domain-containing protein [Gammaproteobacteria bacterium]